MKDRKTIQREAVEAAIPRQRCGWAISVGLGKTIAALSYIYQHWKLNNRIRILIAIPKLPVADVWKNEAADTNCAYLMRNITFTTYLSLHKQPLNYDILILEECHNLLYTHDPWLRNFKGKILGLTGTPPSDKESEKSKMISKYCPVVYTYIMKAAVEDKNLNNYQIVIHPVELSKEKNIYVEYKDKKTGEQKSFYTSELKSYWHLTKKLGREKDLEKQRMAKILRMSTMMSFESKEQYAKKLLSKIKEKCIVFCNTKEQASRLCDYSYFSGNPDSEENLRLFNEGRITKMSTILQLMEGINIKDLRQAIILNTFSGNSPKFMQRLGRLMRLGVNEVATCHVLMFSKSIDEVWVKSALAGLDQKKIKLHVN